LKDMHVRSSKPARPEHLFVQSTCLSIMPPKGAKRSDAHRAKEMQQKGLELARRADYLTVCSVLKDRPDLVHDMKRRLIDDEVLLPCGGLSPTYTPPKLCCKVENRTRATAAARPKTPRMTR
jgi:hypothetical protein